MKVSSYAELYQPREFCESIADHPLFPQRELNLVGGLRGLFDRFSDEYEKCPCVGTKWKTIEQFESFLECGLDGLVYLTVDAHNNEDRCYILEAIPHAILDYAENFREAEKYLTTCHHPIFRKFARQQTQHWKKAVRRATNAKPRIANDIRLLLADSVLPDPYTGKVWESENYTFSLPDGWNQNDHDKFLKDFFGSLSEEDRKWEGFIGGIPFGSITPKLAEAMSKVGHIMSARRLMTSKRQITD